MYIPKQFESDDTSKVISFIREHPFGTIVTSSNEIPVATHLPFIIDESKLEGELTIYSHFAKANPHWEKAINQKSLIIFSEPHAYISPANYSTKLSVPTWNYVAVHIYGNIEIIEDDDECHRVMQKTINTIDRDYNEQWQNLPDDYKESMMNGIKLFKVHPTEIQAKEKLSQNKTIAEQKNIAAELCNRKNSNEIDIGELMLRNIKSK